MSTVSANAASRQQYNYLISPVEGQNLKDIYKTTAGGAVTVPFVLYHDEKTNKFYNSSGAYIAGRALAVKEPAKTFTDTVMVSQYEGRPFNGDLSYTLANTNPSDSKRGFNLIGNPYPSYFDLQKFYQANSGKISPTFYFWDNRFNTELTQLGDSYVNQSYAYINVAAGGSGTGVAASSSPNAAVTRTPGKFAKVAQGFIAQALANNVSVTFNNTMRGVDDTAVGFYGKNTAAADDRFWLSYTGPAQVKNTMAVVYFPNGNDGLGIEDTEIFGTPTDVLYSFVEGKKTIIDGRMPFTVNSVIPLGSVNHTAGNYTVALHKAEGIFANGQNIYLKDKQTGIVTNLSQGSYTFAGNSGDNSGRFEVIYKPETFLATDGTAKGELQVYRDGETFVVKSQSKKITQIEVFDTAGRLIYTVAPNSNSAAIEVDKLTVGMYLLKIHTGSGITVKKVIK